MNAPEILVGAPERLSLPSVQGDDDYRLAADLLAVHGPGGEHTDPVAVRGATGTRR